MKKMLVALGLLAAVAGTAWAQTSGTNTVSQGGYYFNAKTGNKTTSDGDQTVQEQAPAMDANLTFANIISNSSLAAGAGDSSTVLDTHRMRLGMLLIKCTAASGGTDSAATRTVRLAIQVRTHLGGVNDSLSTFPIYLYGSTGQGVTAAASPDSAVTGHLLAGGLGATANLPWSGEQVVQFMTVRQSHNNAVAVGNDIWYYPNGIALPLSSMFGRDPYSPYTSIRVVNLTVPTVSVTVSLVGTPL